MKNWIQQDQTGVTENLQNFSLCFLCYLLFNILPVK
jgi:hypothetical protein